MTACNEKLDNGTGGDDETPEVIPPHTTEDDENTYTLDMYGVALFSQDNELDNYYIALSDAETVINDEGQCMPAAEGMILYLDLYSDIYSTEDNIRIKEGEYKQSLEPKAGVWDINYSFAMKTDSELKSTEMTFMVGTVSVEHFGEGYKISAKLTDATDGTEYTFKYESDKAMVFEPLGGEPEELPTLDKDLNLTLTDAIGNHYLEDPLNPGHETIVLKLADVVLDAEGKLTAPGTLVNLYICSDIIPNPAYPILHEGTYTVKTDFSKGILLAGEDL